MDFDITISIRASTVQSGSSCSRRASTSVCSIQSRPLRRASRLPRMAVLRLLEQRPRHCRRRPRLQDHSHGSIHRAMASPSTRSRHIRDHPFLSNHSSINIQANKCQCSNSKAIRAKSTSLARINHLTRTHAHTSTSFFFLLLLTLLFFSRVFSFFSFSLVFFFPLFFRFLTNIFFCSMYRVLSGWSCYDQDGKITCTYRSRLSILIFFSSDNGGKTRE